MFTFGLSPDIASDDLPVKRLEWTTTPPTEPGWYWCWNGEGYPSVESVFWDEDEEAWVIYANNGEFPDPLPTGCYWLGPLPVPPLPIDETLNQP